MIKIEMLKPQGYCAGVKNAISLAVKIREENPDKHIYIVGYLVHNKDVIDMLDKMGIITLDNRKNDFADLIKDIDAGSILIFPAHGHDEKYDEIAKEKGLIIYDAVCPKVKQNASIVKQEIASNHQVIYIGISNHPETVASLSIDKNVILYDIKSNFDYSKITDNSPLVINQTTLNYKELEAIHKTIKGKIPGVRIQDEICNSTRMRQEKIANLPNDVDLIIVVGDESSSNSNRLVEIAKSSHPNADAFLITNVGQINDELIKQKNHIVISSGASTPNETINMIYAYIVNVFF